MATSENILTQKMVYYPKRLWQHYKKFQYNWILKKSMQIIKTLAGQYVLRTTYSMAEVSVYECACVLFKRRRPNSCAATTSCAVAVAAAP